MTYSRFLKTILDSSKGHFFVIPALLAAVPSAYLYATKGFSPSLGILWLASLALAGCYFFLEREQGEAKWSFGAFLKDSILVVILLGLFAPLYLWQIHDIPVQVNTDEIVIMHFASFHTEEGERDPFSLSPYLRFASLPFIVFGTIGKWLGGITLEHIRLVHAASALAIIAFGYWFFRGWLDVPSALGATVVLGASHVLLAISRMAMRDNTGLLTEVIALGFLVRALHSKNVFLSFLGGVAAGVGFYTYFPGRITIVIWGLALVCSFYLFRDRMTMRECLRLGASSLIGFFLVVTPSFIATAKAPDAFRYQKEQFLIFKEGRALQQYWLAARSPADAVWQNIENGLTSFNKPLTDQGYIYPNEKHGFLDPLSGILLWIGLVAVMLRLLTRSEPKEGDLFPLIGFLALYLVSSFLITKAPNYTRLLVILPFTSVLIIEAVRMIAANFSGMIQKVHRSLALTAHMLLPVLVAIIVVWNMAIFRDFVRKGLAFGNNVGSTARYIEARNNRPGYTFALAADKTHPYYSWGDASAWHFWMTSFTGSGQRVRVVAPSALAKQGFTPPFTLFLSERTWKEAGDGLRTQYPTLRLVPITPDGKHRAIEVE